MAVPTENNRLLDVQEAAEYLKTTPATLRCRVSRRQVPFVKIGRSVRFRVSDLDKWIDRQAVGREWSTGADA